MRARRAKRTRLLLPGVRREPLLVRARRDPELFAEFYARHYEQVLGFFARRTFDPETAFDLMAETFAAAFAGLPRFRGQSEDEALAWFWTIARNQLYRWSDRGVVERRSLGRLGVELAPLSTAEFERIEELASLDPIKAEVMDALDALAADQRHAVRLRVIDEREYSAIAHELGVSEQVARARVSRGLRELARKLEPRRAALRESTG